MRTIRILTNNFWTFCRRIIKSRSIHTTWVSLASLFRNHEILRIHRCINKCRSFSKMRLICWLNSKISSQKPFLQVCRALYLSNQLQGPHPGHKARVLPVPKRRKRKQIIKGVVIKSNAQRRNQRPRLRLDL